MANAIADNFDKNDIKNYTYKDKEYYKIYNRRLYEQKNGKDCKCDICGSIVKFCHLKRHQQTYKCQRIKDSNTENGKVLPLAKRISRLESILSLHGLTKEPQDDNNNDFNISIEEI